MEDLSVPSEIKINFHYSFEEYVEAYRLHYSHLQRLKIKIYISIFFLLLGIGLCIALGYTFLYSLPIYLSVILVSFCVVEFFSGPAKSYSRDPRLKEDHTLIFTNDQITFKFGKMTAALKWKQYTRYLENREFYLLYYGEETFLIVPKRAFADKDKEIFEKILQSKFSPPTT